MFGQARQHRQQRGTEPEQWRGHHHQQEMLDHVGLQQLRPKGMQRRLEGGTDGDHAADKGRETSHSEALREPPVQLQPAAHVDDYGQAEWHLHPEIERPRLQDGRYDPVHGPRRV
jgi:hypothetical protein